MKNMMKTMLCALTLTTAVAAVPAMVSARDNQDVYISDSSTLILRDQADEDANIILCEDGQGYELHVQDYLNGYGYCYVPAFGVNGWVDLSDAYCDDSSDTDDILVDDDDCSEIRYSCVDSGYLALRSQPENSDSNIIAQIYENGTALHMNGECVGDYGYCYVPSLGMSGWVNMCFTY